MSGVSKEPWRCAYCKRLNKSTASCCGTCETTWDKCIDIYYVHGKPSKQEQPWSYADWEEGHAGWSGRQQSRGRHAPQRWESPRKRDSTPRQKGKDSPRQRTKKKNNKGKDAFSFPTLGGQPPPWPNPDTAYSTSYTGFAPMAMPQAPLPPPTTPPPGASSPQADALLVAAVRKEYPDLSKAPADIREAMERAETMSSQQIAAALHRATNRVRQSSDRLRDLRDSQIKHKEAWHVHLKDAITSWESQVQSYTSQRNAYKSMMEKTREDLQAARKEIQRLNHLAAGAGKVLQVPTVDLTEPEEILIDMSDSQVLMEKMQETLRRCSQVILDTEKADKTVHLESDEDMPLPTNKRPRSVEPGGNEPPGGGSSIGATS